MSDNVCSWIGVDGKQIRGLKVELRDSLNRGQSIILSQTIREVLVCLCENREEHARVLDIASTDGVAEVLKSRVGGKEIRGIRHSENCVVNWPWEFVKGS